MWSIALVVGAAVGALIASLSDGLILPIIGIFLGGGVNAGQVEINGQIIDFTLMINAIITFIITMLVIYFLFVVPMNRLRERYNPKTEAGVPPDVALLTEIRDLLKAQQDTPGQS